jgi:hypothetical protein
MKVAEKCKNLKGMFDDTFPLGGLFYQAADLKICCVEF